MILLGMTFRTIGGMELSGVPFRELLLVCLFGVAGCYLTIPLVRRGAIAVGAVAIPRERDVHGTNMPRIGGAGVFLGMCTACALAMRLPALSNGFVYSSAMIATFTSAAIVMCVGAIDDILQIPPAVKLMGQIVAGLALALGGVRWRLLPGDGTVVVLDYTQSVLLTVILTVVIINAMNFTDGLDGLASGLAIVSFATVASFSAWRLNQSGGDVSYYSPLIVSTIGAGACIGFLFHNAHPAQIFLGDTGSMLLGVIVTSAVTQVTGMPLVDINEGLLTAFSPIIVFAGVILIPVLDATVAIVRRAASHKPIYIADKLHLHHRLLSIGFSHPAVVLLIICLASALSGMCLAISIQAPGWTLATIGFCACLCLLVICSRAFKMKLHN